jgi:hypothetical protein
MTDKLDAACKQLDCAIRLVAAHEDQFAVHTLVMAAFGILNDLGRGRLDEYQLLYKSYFTRIGWARLTGTANYLKHADRDPNAMLDSLDPRENDWRIGVCLLLYRSLRGTLSTTMAAFHVWMVVLHPDEFRLAEDADNDFEQSERSDAGLTEVSATAAPSVPRQRRPVRQNFPVRRQHVRYTAIARRRAAQGKSTALSARGTFATPD